MNKMGRWEQPYELLLKSYQEGCKYYGDLKKQGQLIDMTMSEFADYYRNSHSYSQPECALWRDILYGSNKQIFWYCDPYMRAQVNMDQGGAIVDLRPYVSKLDWDTGIGSQHIQDVSYPYLIQEKYRAGYFTHYAGEGTIRSAKVCYQNQEVDLCLCRTKAHFSQIDKTRILTLDPVEIEFSDLKVKIVTTIKFKEGSSEIEYDRKIVEMSDPSKEVTINEYIVGSYGTTEYPMDMSSLVFDLAGQKLNYEYKCRQLTLENADYSSVNVKPINTNVVMTCQGDNKVGYIKEGYAFSPMFTLGYNVTLKNNQEVKTWLKLQKAN